MFIICKTNIKKYNMWIGAIVISCGWTPIYTSCFILMFVSLLFFVSKSLCPFFKSLKSSNFITVLSIICFYFHFTLVDLIKVQIFFFCLNMKTRNLEERHKLECEILSNNVYNQNNF